MSTAARADQRRESETSAARRQAVWVLRFAAARCAETAEVLSGRAGPATAAAAARAAALDLARAVAILHRVGRPVPEVRRGGPGRGRAARPA